MSTKKTKKVIGSDNFTTSMSELLTHRGIVCYTDIMEKQGKWLSKNVGKIFADRRTALHLTQSDMAGALRLQRTSISNIESGNQVILLDVFYDFCQILKLDPADVINEATRSQGHLDQIEKIVQQVTLDDKS